MTLTPAQERGLELVAGVAGDHKRSGKEATGSYSKGYDAAAHDIQSAILAHVEE